MIKKSQQKRRTSPSNYKERFFVLDTQDLKYSERRPGVSISIHGNDFTTSMMRTYSELHNFHNKLYTFHNMQTLGKLSEDVVYFQKKPTLKGCIELSRIKCVEIVCSDVPIPCTFKYPFQVRYHIYHFTNNSHLKYIYIYNRK